MSVLVDTNVLVYAEDTSDPVKREIADAVVARLVAQTAAVVTPQVLAEFQVVVSRLFGATLSAEEAFGIFQRYALAFRVLPLDRETSLLAGHAATLYRMHFYDAQIWASARLNGVGWVLSENFSDGLEIEGVRFADPFAPGFDVELLLAE